MVVKYLEANTCVAKKCNTWYWSPLWQLLYLISA